MYKHEIISGILFQTRTNPSQHIYFLLSQDLLAHGSPFCTTGVGSKKNVSSRFYEGLSF